MGMSRGDRRQRIGEVVERCGLLPVRRRTIGRLSKGNRQRVGLAAALLHEPSVLILDEPTSGLDPGQVIELRRLIRELAGGHTVLLSTHILSEVQSVCDEAIIIARGRVVAAGTVEQLRQQAGGQRAAIVVECKATEPQAKKALQGLAGEFTRPSMLDGGWLRFTFAPTDEPDMREAIANALHQQDVAVREITRESSSLEAFFVKVTDPRNAFEHPSDGGVGLEDPKQQSDRKGGDDE
jgi:ABC-2 type transport system ATP-binding protein